MISSGGIRADADLHFRVDTAESRNGPCDDSESRTSNFNLRAAGPIAPKLPRSHRQNEHQEQSATESEEQTPGDGLCFLFLLCQELTGLFEQRLAWVKHADVVVDQQLAEEETADRVSPVVGGFHVAGPHLRKLYQGL